MQSSPINRHINGYLLNAILYFINITKNFNKHKYSNLILCFCVICVRFSSGKMVKKNPKLEQDRTRQLLLMYRVACAK